MGEGEIERKKEQGYNVIQKYDFHQVKMRIFLKTNSLLDLRVSRMISGNAGGELHTKILVSHC